MGAAVLTEEGGDPPPLREPKQRAEVARQRRRAEVEQIEVGRAVREPSRKPLELGGPAGDRLAVLGNTVVPVEDANAGRGSPGRREQTCPTPPRPQIATGASTINPHEARPSGRIRPA